MKSVLMFVLGSLVSASAFALPMLDQVKVVGENSEAALTPDHKNSKLFYYTISSFAVCRESDGSPKGFFLSNLKSDIPYVSMSYMLCPEIAGNAGATSAQAEQAIRTFIKETGSKVVPLTPKVEVTPEGLWRVLFDQLHTKVVYECTPQKGLKLICNLFGEGGRRYDVASPEAFDARLLYDLYIKNSSALNGYFSSKVSGYVQAKPDSPELENIVRDINIAFWAEPNFKAYPAKSKLNWIPSDN